MLIGNSNAGKSTLACSMKNKSCEHDHPTTHGVLIDDLRFGGISYNLWDFGGQEVYHGTHRLFLTSAALQVIVFDAETEKTAERYQPVHDRARAERQVMNHPLEYWYQTTRELSPDSQFFIVQNKKRRGEPERPEAVHQDQSKLVALNAKTGEDVDDLLYFLKKHAGRLPDYGMVMPRSWLKVRQFFIDNLETENNIKIIEHKDFEKLCDDNGVMEQAKPLLLEYLHHNGFLYRHVNLGEKIIADQRWALNAIYKPYDRHADHYQEFLDLHGKIRVWKLFQVLAMIGLTRSSKNGCSWIS